MAKASDDRASPAGERMILTSRGLAGWLAQEGVSLALTTYQAGGCSSSAASPTAACAPTSG